MNPILFNILYLILALYCKTWRIKRHDSKEFLDYCDTGRAHIGIAWHDQLLALTYTGKGGGHVTVTSKSKDGDLVAKILARWGFIVSRGSSSKGGAKVVGEFTNYIKAGRSLYITVDGPRGPRHRIKPGAIYIAKNNNCALVPILMNCKHFIRFNSWDKFILPLPFARVDMYYTEPVFVDYEEGAASLAKEVRRVNDIMNERTDVYSTYHI